MKYVLICLILILGGLFMGLNMWDKTFPKSDKVIVKK